MFHYESEVGSPDVLHIAVAVPPYAIVESRGESLLITYVSWCLFITFRQKACRVVCCILLMPDNDAANFQKSYDLAMIHKYGNNC